MSNSYFQFKHFVIHQERCGMKVGTDGTLLGAWATLPQSAVKISEAISTSNPSAVPWWSDGVLDIGTGTGLIALMLAQRFPNVPIVGIDIDADAVIQAQGNVANAPFDNVSIVQADIKEYITCGKHFAAIVSNPPYFVRSLTPQDAQRALARHAESMSYRDLIMAVRLLLTDDGEFSVVIPADCKSLLESEAYLAGLFKSRECAVKTTPKKPAKRYLMAFRKHPCSLEMTEGVIELAPNNYSQWYQQLTKDFYL